MPAITSGRVLVTGANGYVAVWILKYLLDHGFTVRGTVRSEKKSAYLRELFKDDADRLELVVIENITEDGVFDAAVQDTDAILHVASPVHLSAKDPNEVIVPAVRGTESILQSALKYRSTVKRVVITSSSSAIISSPRPGESLPRVLDENDWNEESVKEVEVKGRDASPMHKYRASKVLAEKAAWAFYEREKNRLGEDLGWDLVVVNPPYVFGPFLHEAPTIEAFGSTARDWYNHVVKGDLAGDDLVRNGLDWVDVRDLAQAEVLTLTTPNAGGERLIIRGGSFVWQQFINAARRYSDKIPPGDVEHYDPAKIFLPVVFNADKSRRVLGMEYRALEETARDAIADFESRGWLF
ncbi:D-lactaldehyde dehydrogenase [Trametes polyzona]|nr:D-lactaldehyde dehydrogenase [Trametes polyzona]